MKENLQLIIRNALDITQGAQVPPHLESVAFGKVLDILAARSESDGRTNSGVPPSAAQRQERHTPDESPTKRIAAKLGLVLSVVEQVFSSDAGNGIEVIIGPGRLGASKKAGTQEIAILVAGGRQIAGLEEWTSTKRIREVCDHYRKFDSDNFARDIKELDDVFGFKGKGRMMEVKINRPGTDRLSSLITTLTDPSK
jgi:hypothetical protein